jgi:tetratricopeptide (TPR) repeat protein
MVRARWLFVLMLTLSSRALAQDSTTTAQPDSAQAASEHFERGVQLFKEQAFRAAIVEFQRAYDLAPDYRLHYNLGRAKQQLQDYLGAAENYEAFLVQGGSEVPAERRAQLEETLSALSGRVARIDVKVSRAGADVFVDDVKVGMSPLEALVRTNVGRHRISARSADGALGSEIIDVAGGDLAEVSLTLAEPEPALASTPKAEPADDARGRSPRQKLALASWIAGGAMLAGSVVTGVFALRDQDSLHTQVGKLGVDPNAVATQRDKVDALSLTTDVLIGAGAALVVSGTLLWLLGDKRGERARDSKPTTQQARVGLDLGFGSLALRGRF